MMFNGFRLFVPILAGANLRDRLIGSLGALIGICLTGLITALVMGRSIELPLIVAPIGASAVLIFAVPASPLAQPWSIIGGNMISALVGITVARFVGNPLIAIGLGVALAIAAMSVSRCLHPPGGAAALTAIIGGSSVTDLGYQFAFIPVGLNSVLLVALGIAFHKLAGRKYPHVPAAAPANTHKTSDLPAPLRVGFTSDDIATALKEVDETFDIDPGDLDRLLRQVELQALIRTGQWLRKISCRAMLSALRNMIVRMKHGACCLSTISALCLSLVNKESCSAPLVCGSSTTQLLRSAR
jgi:CBS domain-containing membrane protein